MGVTSGTETPYPSCVVRVAQTLVLYVVFCRSLFVCLSVFFCRFGHCIICPSINRFCYLQSTFLTGHAICSLMTPTFTNLTPVFVLSKT
jgi:hypothetical protein